MENIIRYDARQGSVDKQKEYNDYQLNWRDDGDELMDPSTNDYLKGYNIDPYEFKQWASAKHKKKFTAMVKQGSGEVFVMQFSPEFLADRILTLWNGADGTLQNFFEAFTLRYNNALKSQVAAQLAKQGYTVYPVLIDDKPRYAKRLEKLMTKVAKSKNLDAIMAFATQVSKSDSLHLYAGELADLKETGHKINLTEASGILDYYMSCFPEDYAIKLVSGLMNGQQPKVNYDRFENADWDFSDESLQKIEDYMSGNADPQYTHANTPGGWDFVSDMRSFDGTAPGKYEISAKLKKKCKNKRF